MNICSKYSAVEFWGATAKTTVQHQSMQDNPTGRLGCVVQGGIVPGTPDKKPHSCTGDILFCCLLILPISLQTLHNLHSPHVCFQHSSCLVSKAVLETTLTLQYSPVKNNVITLVRIHTYKPACSPDTAMTSLWISAPATVSANFAIFWYGGSLGNRDSGELILWKIGPPVLLLPASFYDICCI